MTNPCGVFRSVAALCRVGWAAGGGRESPGKSAVAPTSDIGVQVGGAVYGGFGRDWGTLAQMASALAVVVGNQA